MKYLIYAVEDDESIRELYKCAISGEEYSVKVFASGDEFFKKIMGEGEARKGEKELPNLIILDLMLPDMDGMEILAKVRKEQNTRNIPVIIVSAKGDELSLVKGLNCGADDYMAKPFSILELMARIKANLRGVVASQTLVFGDFVLDMSKISATLQGEELGLTPKEINVLKILLQNLNQVVKRDYLLDEVWGYDFVGESRTLDNHIKSLRSKLSIHIEGEAIVTIRGVGFMMKESNFVVKSREAGGEGKKC